jgi:hypothetical protein
MRVLEHYNTRLVNDKVFVKKTTSYSNKHVCRNGRHKMADRTYTYALAIGVVL